MNMSLQSKLWIAWGNEGGWEDAKYKECFHDQQQQKQYEREFKNKCTLKIKDLKEEVEIIE